jgi:hypothetical protein
LRNIHARASESGIAGANKCDAHRVQIIRPAGDWQARQKQPQKTTPECDFGFGAGKWHNFYQVTDNLSPLPRDCNERDSGDAVKIVLENFPAGAFN